MAGEKWDKSQIQSISSQRADEHQTWVHFFSACFGTTALLLIALFKDGSFPERIAGIIICSFGCIGTLVLAYIQRRAYISMDGLEKALKEAEKDLKLKSSVQYIVQARIIGARPIMNIFSFSQSFAWGIGIILFMCREI